MSLHAPPSTLANLLVFGAGGHARVVADALALAIPELRRVGSDRDPARCQGMLLPGVPLVLPEHVNDALAPNAKVHVAIGVNAAREREAIIWGLQRLYTVVHPAASVSPYARIESGAFVAAQAVVGPQAYVGQGAIVNHGAIVDHDVQVGDFAHVAPNAALGGGARIGLRVLLGAGAVVLPSVYIADDAVIGAGAVVCESVIEAGTYIGVPARRVA